MPSWLPARAQVGAAMASCWHETEGMAGQPCPPTKLKYLAVTVMTAASTVLGKSVRFLEHVSPGYCACQYREYRAGVRGQDVPPDQMSPRTRDPRTRCPPGHVVLGPDVPRQDRMSPLPLPQTHVSLASVQT